MRKGVAVPAVMTREEQDLLALQEWEAGQSQPPTLFDVLATRSVGLVGAYILRAFREAAAVAVEESERVAKIRRLVLEACDGDLERAEELLRSPNDLFEGATPLAVTVASEKGGERVIQAISRLESGQRSSRSPSSH